MDPIGRMTGPAGPVAARPSARAGGAFSVSSGAAPPAASISACAPGLLLAAQESGAEAVRERQARQRGRALLRELTALQGDILRESPGPERLARLRALVADPPLPADPALRDAVAAIVLRARIELARFGGT